MAATRKGRRVKAVLDLKAAYDRVPRDTLMQEIRKRISSNVTAMISHSLQESTFTVAGDMTKTKGYCRRGVPQGSLVWPTLFDMLMDTLADMIIGLDINDGLDNARRVNMFADDVMIFGQQQKRSSKAC